MTETEKKLLAENAALKRRLDAIETKLAPPPPAAHPGQYKDPCGGWLRDARGNIISNATEEEVLARNTLTDEQRRNLHRPKNCEFDDAGNTRLPDGLWRDREGRLLPHHGKEQPTQEVPVVPVARHRGSFVDTLIDRATPLYTRVSEQGE
jgi:hypothetical protein